MRVIQLGAIAVHFLILLGCSSSDGAGSGNEPSLSTAGSTSPTNSTGGDPSASTSSTGQPKPPPFVLPTQVTDCGLAGDVLGEPLAVGPCIEQSITGSEQYPYCIKSHPACASAGGECPVYVTIGVGDAYFDRVEHPEKYGRFMVVRLHPNSWQARGTQERQFLSALLSTLRQKYPGLDNTRIYGVAFSNATDTLSSLRTVEEGNTITDFAATVALGYCQGHSKPEENVPMHSLMITGEADETHAGNHGTCQSLDPGKPDRVLAAAQSNGCDGPGVWANVNADNPYMMGPDGSDVVRQRTFGNCTNGDLLHYVFLDESHTQEYKKHFAPPLKGLDIGWNFLQGRTKPAASGVQGLISACRK